MLRATTSLLCNKWGRDRTNAHAGVGVEMNTAAAAGPEPLTGLSCVKLHIAEHTFSTPWSKPCWGAMCHWTWPKVKQVVPQHPAVSFWCCCLQRGRDLWVWVWLIWGFLDGKFFYIYCLAADNWLLPLMPRGVGFTVSGSNTVVEIRRTQ